MIGDVLQKKYKIALSWQIQKMIERMYEAETKLNHRESTKDTIRKIEAGRFSLMNSFLTYVLGPLRKAKPTRRPSMPRVKHITNLAGMRTMVAKRKKASSKKKPEMPKAMPAFM